MLKIPSGEFQRHLGRCLDDALSQPLVITRRKREVLVLVLLAKDEYDRLKDLETHYTRQTLKQTRKLISDVQGDFQDETE